MVGTPRGHVTFHRTVMTGPAGAVFAAIGAVAFLGGAVWMLSAVPFPMNLLAAGMFAFFGVLMGLGAFTGLSRSGDPRSADVGPEGLWLPEMGFLRWSEIAEVRLESMRAIGSAEAAVTMRVRRLGVVPRDPSRRPAASTALGWRMAQAYYGLVNRLAPEVRLGAEGLAPFGVAENEIRGDFDALLAAVRAHADIVDADERRARELAPRWGGLDAAGRGAHATFGLPATSWPQVVLSLVQLAVPLTFVLPLVIPWIARGDASTFIGLGFLAFVVIAFVLPGVRSLSRVIRRELDRRSEPDRLRVTPDAIWLRSLGEVPWDDVKSIRTVRGGWADRVAGPPVERWLLEVVAGTSAGTQRTAEVASDELDAPFDEVLDVLRLYHEVVETG